MNIPGIGEVKGWQVGIGVAATAGIVTIYYIRRKSAANAAAVAAAATPASTVDTSAVDTSGYSGGSSYNNGDYSYGGYEYGGIDPSTGVPYVLEGGTASSTTSSSGITTNSEWVTQAEAAAVTSFGATQSLATSAVSKYMSQTRAGLSPDEYQLMQAVLAQLGSPPTGGPYQLIQASSGTTTGTMARNPVQGLRVGSVTNQTVSLYWTRDPNATSYEVLYGGPNDFTHHTTAPGGQDGITIGGLAPNTTFNFQITAEPAASGATLGNITAHTSR